MKRIIFTTLIVLVTITAFAQKSKTDSVRIFDRKKREFIKVTRAEYDRRGDSLVKRMEKKGNLNVGKFKFGPTFSRIDLGLTTLIDNGSFTLQPKNDFLSYRSWKSSNVGFDLVQLEYTSANRRFSVYLSGGFDWTLIRLRKDITIQKNSAALTYTNDTIHYTKNRFSANYLRIPLSFEFTTKEGRGKHTHFIIGPEVGLLMSGRVKQKSEENGKQKIDDDYHFAKMRYGAFVRMGSGPGGIYAKYYFNDMFENSPAQKGLKNFAFGFTLGF